MNLTNLTLTGIDELNIPDSLNAPLLKLKIGRNNNTIAPNTNKLIITVKNGMNPNSEVKTYEFLLSSPLNYIENTSDEFVIEPVIIDNQIKMKAYITRYIQNNTVLSVPFTELLEYQPITLFQGVNHFRTNYADATIEMIYPQDNELVRNFLNNSLFNERKENASLTWDDIYFKDVFTKENNQINATVNQLTVGCLTSSNNTFSLDQEGNLNVKSIHSTEKIPAEINPLQIYPVGSIYLSVNNTNPNNYFGGSWTQIAQGRTLVGVDTSQTEFNTVKKTGGSKTVTLTTGQMPNHKHTVVSWINKTDWTFGEPVGNDRAFSNVATGGDGTWKKADSFQGIEAAGNNEAHNNLQPYFTCYIWCRTA